jgi:hypothetical protein
MLMRSRTESTIFIPLKVDVTHTLEYLQQLNETQEEKLSIFNILLTAIARTITMRPQLNRFVIGTDLYQRNRIQISFIAKKQFTESAPERNVKMTFQPHDTLFTISANLRAELSSARSEEGNAIEKDMKGYEGIPHSLLGMGTSFIRWMDHHNLITQSMIDSDPLYTSCYLTNVGSIKMGAPYHHLFEWGNASLFIGIGQYVKTPVVAETGEIVVREIMDIVTTYDDRVSEGFYGARALQLMKNFIENPEQLEKPAELDPEILEELQLRKEIDTKKPKKSKF